MGQAQLSIDRQTFQGTVAAGGGTFTADYAVPTDRVARLIATILITRLAAAHLADSAVLVAECAIENKNGVTSLVTAAPGSANPKNAIDLIASRAEGCDANFLSGGGAAPTCVWSAIAGGGARLTVTNNNAANAGDVTVYVEAIIGGST